MKITDLAGVKTAKTKATDNKTSSGKSGSTSSAGSVSKSDDVALSEVAKAVSTSSVAVNEGASAERVAELKKMRASGFPINTFVLAQQILEEEMG